MKPDANTRLSPHEETLFTQLHDGEAVLLHLKTHAYYGLNETGTRIWQLVSEELTLGEICDKLQDEFDVGEEEIRKYVSEFADELSAAKLVELSN